MTYKWKVVHVIVPALALLGAGCGGGDSGSSGPSTPANTTISNSSGAKDATSAGVQSAILASSSATGLTGLAAGSLAPSLANVPARPLAKQDVVASKVTEAQARAMKRLAPQIAAARSSAATRVAYSAGPYSCGVSGTWSVSGDDGFNSGYTAVTGPFTFVVTYNNCRELESSTVGFETNGSFAISLPLDAATGYPTGSITLTFGDGNSTLSASDFTNKEYSVSGVTWTGPVATFTASMTFSGTHTDTSTPAGCLAANCAVNSGSYGFSANGAQSYVAGSHSWELAFNSLSLSGAYSHARVDGTWGNLNDTHSYDDTLNGGITQTHKVSGTVQNSFAVSYYGFRLRETGVNAGNGTWRIDGKVTTDMTPNSCFEGTFSFVTNTPVAWDTQGLFTAGNITINDNVTVTFSGSTITVTYNGVSESLTEAGLFALCPIETGFGV